MQKRAKSRPRQQPLLVACPSVLLLLAPLLRCEPMLLWKRPYPNVPWPLPSHEMVTGQLLVACWKPCHSASFPYKTLWCCSVCYASPRKPCVLWRVLQILET